MSFSAQYTVTLAGFSNPKYFSPGGQADATGFDLCEYTGYSVSFTGTGVSTVVHEQTMDPTGVAGWFPVAGSIVSATTSTLSTAGSTSGSCYMFPAIGVRARIRVTALTTGDAVAQVNLMPDAVAVQPPATTTTAAGQAAHDAVISVNPVRVAGRALTANYTAVASGDVADIITTLVGAQVIRPFSIPELEWNYAAASGGIVNTTTAVTIKTAAAAGIRNYITGIQISHATLSGATELVIRDGASGTVIFRTQLQTTAVESLPIVFQSPLKSTAATLLEVATLTAVTGAVYVNAQGYAAP